MTTIVINDNSDEGRMLMNMIRAAQESSDAVVGIHDDELDAFLDSLPFEKIPGMPYSDEERIASVRRAEESIRAGQTITSEELKRKMASW